jgi:adenylosuccinate lyase
LAEELPFLASEALMMAAVRAGGDRQAVHEALRVKSREAARAMKEEGAPNQLRELLEKDPAFAKVRGGLGELLDPRRFVGRAPEQVDEFLEEDVEPALERYAGLEAAVAEVRV